MSNAGFGSGRSSGAVYGRVNQSDLVRGLVSHSLTMRPPGQSSEGACTPICAVKASIGMGADTQESVAV
jgi:hypothetical protein